MSGGTSQSDSRKHEVASHDVVVKNCMILHPSSPPPPPPTHTHTHTHTNRTYNIQAISFTPCELVKEMGKYFPDLQVKYEPDERQQIGMCVCVGGGGWVGRTTCTKNSKSVTCVCEC